MENSAWARPDGLRVLAPVALVVEDPMELFTTALGVVSAPNRGPGPEFACGWAVAAGVAFMELAKAVAQRITDKHPITVTFLRWASPFKGWFDPSELAAAWREVLRNFFNGVKSDVRSVHRAFRFIETIVFG
jgi:hypothetical protein